MAIKTENGVTTLTPTGWKWFVGAAVSFFLIPGFGMLIAIFFVLTGAGVLRRVTLSKDGLKARSLFSNKTHAWTEIGDFRVYKVKSGLITAANMVSFTHVDKQGTMMGKAAKLLAGGTHSIPSLGMKPQKLIQLMQAYKMGYVPKDSELPVPTTPARELAPAAALPVAPIRASRPRAVPATPRKQSPMPKRQTIFGEKRKTSTTLVQDGGGLFGRRGPSSPFER